MLSVQDPFMFATLTHRHISLANACVCMLDLTLKVIWCTTH